MNNSKGNSDKKIRGIGGSDANRIMKGDTQSLWAELTGRKEREDLSDVLRVQMGTFTEPFNITWYKKQTGNRSFARTPESFHEILNLEVSQGQFGPEVRHPANPWMVCSPDDLIDNGSGIVLLECKHTNEWMFKTPEKLVANYYPQLQHNMEVCGLDKAHLSFFGGNGSWDYVEVEYDMEYVMRLVEAEEAFWENVINDTPPSPSLIVDPDPREGSVRKRIEIDMTQGNRSSEWKEQAEIWADKKPDADAFNRAVKRLKGMFPDEADEAYGHGITIKKSKSGSKTISIPKF